MKIHRARGGDVKVEGDFWPLGHRFAYFPATQILVYSYDFCCNWVADQINPDLPNNMIEQIAIDITQNTYNLNNKEDLFNAIKLLYEEGVADGKHEVSFNLRKLMEH